MRLDVKRIAGTIHPLRNGWILNIHDRKAEKIMHIAVFRARRRIKRQRDRFCRTVLYNSAKSDRSRARTIDVGILRGDKWIVGRGVHRTTQAIIGCCGKRYDNLAGCGNLF